MIQRKVFMRNKSVHSINSQNGYHMKILFGHFNAKVGTAGIIRNESLHENNNDSGIM